VQRINHAHRCCPPVDADPSLLRTGALVPRPTSD
jgi:hypothetical protein